MNIIEYLRTLDLPQHALEHLDIIEHDIMKLELTLADVGTLEQYLRLHHVATVAYTAAEQYDFMLGERRHPLFDVYINSVKEQKQLANALGLNPKSRLTLKNLGGETVDEDSDPLLKLFTE